MIFQRRDVYLWLLGGSAGSFNPIRRFIQQMPFQVHVAIVVCMHRLRSLRMGMVEAMGGTQGWVVLEPDDKTIIQGGHIYIAPADYHLLVEPEGYFSLSVDEPVHFSRPSIDVLLEAVVGARWPRAGAALLSGANKDGAWGLYRMYRAGYFTAVQEPSDAEMPTMPQAALSLFEPHRRFTADRLVEVCLYALSL
ncbi:MAG: chemotaxis protein CheB [Bacteroidia bacterium]|nr:chemotaxis protein CheB [Bacteroidia bacterium]MDW8088554.1 chemotaxis protein CheB [Bacteroidia bacterium]